MTLAECDIALPLVDLVDFRYVLMNTFQGAHTGIANLKSSLRFIISGSPHSSSADIRRGECKGGHQSKPAQSLCTVVGSFLTIVRLTQPKAVLMLTSHRALFSALPVMLSQSPTRGLGVTSLVRPVSSPTTRTRRRKLSQLLRSSLQPKAGPKRSEVIYFPLRLQPLLTPRLTSCLFLYPYSHRSGQALEWRWMLSWIRAAQLAISSRRMSQLDII